jgi:hypothetical protein
VVIIGCVGRVSVSRDSVISNTDISEQRTVKEPKLCSSLVRFGLVHLLRSTTNSNSSSRYYSSSRRQHLTTVHVNAVIGEYAKGSEIVEN